MNPEIHAESPPVICAISEYKGTKVTVLEDVYEPAEDTFLMADCAVSAVLNSRAPDDLNDEYFVLEIGCGSGFVSAFLQNHFSSLRLTAVDINPAAVLCSRMNGVRSFESDMFDIFETAASAAAADAAVASAAAADAAAEEDIPQKPPFGFDFIFFNPPYLPTSDDEKVNGPLNYAFDGGVDGRGSINRFLTEVGAYLRSGGFFLLLISSITGFSEVSAEMKKHGFSVEVAGTSKVSFEELMVLKGKRI
ncbi:MAG: methyltransferase [Methanosarcinales archaeon]|nr:methyltransferase [Methanosarcinales archaeon]